MYILGHSQKEKTAAYTLKRIFTNPTSDRWLISKIYKDLKKLVSKTPNNPIKSGVKNYIDNSQ